MAGTPLSVKVPAESATAERLVPATERVTCDISSARNPVRAVLETPVETTPEMVAPVIDGTGEDAVADVGAVGDVPRLAQAALRKKMAAPKTSRSIDFRICSFSALGAVTRSRCNLHTD